MFCFFICLLLFFCFWRNWRLHDIETINMQLNPTPNQIKHKRTNITITNKHRHHQQTSLPAGKSKFSAIYFNYILKKRNESKQFLCAACRRDDAHIEYNRYSNPNNMLHCSIIWQADVQTLCEIFQELTRTNNEFKVRTTTLARVYFSSCSPLVILLTNHLNNIHKHITHTAAKISSLTTLVH